MSAAAYPANLEGEIELRDGARLKVRPIRPEDAPRLEQGFFHLSAGTRRARFHSGIRALSPGMLQRFTRIDYDREMALVAVDESAGGDLVGVARYFRLDERGCEFAIVVDDAWQGRGLGSRLMRRLIEAARAQGLESMVGFVLADNIAMLNLAARLGFEMVREDANTRRVTLGLS
jgi:acetyltransferase